MINCKVIVSGPAIGKTYLAKIDKRFIDLDGEKAIYKYGLEGKSDFELESTKLNRGKVVNTDSKEYVYKRLNEELKKGNICMLSYNQKDIINYLVENNIPYCLVYADITLCDEYISRMKNRGNPQKFIDQKISEWKDFYTQNVNDENASYKIKLSKGEFLSDYAKMFFYN